MTITLDGAAELWWGTTTEQKLGGGGRRVRQGFDDTGANPESTITFRKDTEVLKTPDILICFDIGGSTMCHLFTLTLQQNCTRRRGNIGSSSDTPGTPFECKYTLLSSSDRHWSYNTSPMFPNTQLFGLGLLVKFSLDS